MSQYPPPGGQGFPPNYSPNVPPGGMGGYSLPAATTTSAAAVTSLVCGLLFCIPGVTGLIAVLTGIVGLVATGKPTVKGRGMAVAGLILGIISLVGWGAAGLGGFALYRTGKPAQRVARQYISDLSAGNLDQCLQNSTPAITKDQLTSISKAMQGWGSLNEATVFGFSGDNKNFVSTGMCKFANSQHSFKITLIKDSSGQLKVDTFLWQN